MQKIQIQIGDFGGCTAATIPIEAGKITLLGGRNGAGKSSIIRGAQSVLVGKEMIDGAAKNASGEYVKQGAQVGFAHLTGDLGERRIVWKKDTASQEGESTVIGANAVGMSRFTSLKPEERAGLLTKFVDCEPTQAEFEAEIMKEINWGAKDERTTKLWQSITSLGWKTALKEAEEDGVVAKRDFKAITGQQWGRAQSGNWEPEGWAPTNATPESLTQEVNEGKKKLEEAIRAEGAAAGNIEALKEDLDQLGTLEERSMALKTEIKDLEAKVTPTQNTLNLLREGLQQHGTVHDCPHCEKGISIVGGKLVAAVAPDPTELAQSQKNVEVQEKALKQLTATVQALRNELAGIGVLITKAKDAAKEIARIENARSQKTTVKVDDIRADIAHAETTLDAITRFAKARALHQKLLDNEKLQTLLAPDGLKGQKLAGALAEFSRQHLSPLCAAAGWYEITIDPDMSVRYHKIPGGKLYRHLSKGERYRVNAILQVAIAKLQKAPLVVFDDGDELESSKEGRGGLLNLLIRSGVASLVAIADVDLKNLPNLAEKGAGHTFWVVDGVATPVAELAGVS